MEANMGKLWANSGDSHLVEPDDLFETRLPQDLADRMPRSVKDEDGAWETVYVDGQEFRRRMPKPGTAARSFGDDDGLTERRMIGGRDVVSRLKDLDDEGVWGELTYPSLGIW